MRIRILSFLFPSALLLGITAGQASALTFDLNQIINGGTSLTPTPVYGTITLSKSETSVKIDVALTDTTQKLLGFYLNCNDSKFGDLDQFSLSNNASIRVDENKIKPDGYSGKFDFKIPVNGKLGNVPTFSAILTDSYQSLTEADFDFKDTFNNLYAAAHIGNLSTQDDSIWIGSDGNTPPAPAPAPVPEPGTMALLGAGFLGLTVFGKRRKIA